jgi:hypothetical protein
MISIEQLVLKRDKWYNLWNVVYRDTEAIQAVQT